jgi:competence protein ComEC
MNRTGKPGKRPLLLVASSYAAGIVVARFVAVPLPAGLLAAFVLTTSALAWPRARLALLYAACFMAGVANYSLKSAALSPFDIRSILGNAPALATVRGTLLETPTERVYELDGKEIWSTMARIQLAAIRTNGSPWQPAEGVIAVTFRSLVGSNIFGGQVVEISGVIAPPKTAVAEGTFDYRAFLVDKGIYYLLRADKEKPWTVVRSPPRPPLADRFRDWARGALAIGLPEEDQTLRLEWALTLGWKQVMTEEVSEPFVRAATFHIFAVDGLRMAIISGIFITILRVLRVPRALCGVILLPLIWSYTAVTGWPASAVRANVMLTVVLLGWILKRPSDTTNSLFAAALLILLWEPRQLFQAGFQLSFIVVYYIILIDTAVRRFWQRFSFEEQYLPDQLRPRWHFWARDAGRYVAELFCSSAVAWIASVPLVAYYFNIFSLVSTPANMLAVPLCALVLIANISSLLLAAWFPAGAAVFNFAGWGLMRLIEVTSQWFADWPRAYLYFSRPELVTTVLYYAVLWAIASGWALAGRYRAWKSAVVCAAVCAWGVNHWWQAATVTRLTILPVNGGMALHFQSPNARKDLLIDCGDTNGVRFITKPYLRAQGVNELPTMVLTHGDLRHIGGAELIDGLFKVRNICVSPVRFRSAAYRRFVNDWSGVSNKLQTVVRSNTVSRWTVLHPAVSDRFAQADDNAVVLDGTFHGCRVLLLSDLGRPGQEALMERTPDLRADIVVTGLPVKNGPICDALLDRIQPRLIIVADSESPPTEQAGAEVHERLARRQIPVLYTRFCGAVTLEWRKRGWELRTMDGLRMRSDALPPVPDPFLERAQEWKKLSEPQGDEVGEPQ